MCGHGLVEIAAGAEVGETEDHQGLDGSIEKFTSIAREDEGLAHGQPDR